MQAPKFSLPDQNGTIVTLDSFKGKKVVLYFYPKADTPGCTTQACGLRDNIGELRKNGVVVVGVSPDELAALKKFADKYTLPFTLLADPSTKVIQAYKVWGEKQFMGNKYMGVLRTTILIDEQGAIMKRYNNVKPETHTDSILADIRAAKTNALGDIAMKDVHAPVKIVKKIPMKEPSRKSPTKSVDKKIIAKAARKITKEEQKVALKKVAKK